MTTLVKTLAALAAGTMLATGALAQSGRIDSIATPLVAIENEPAPKLTVGTPLPGALARGVAIIPYRVENLRVTPLLGADAAKLSPRVGHLHVTVDDAPFYWADFGATNAIVVSGLKPGQHKVKVEVADPVHRIVTAQTVTFTVPGPTQ
jgi:hypothetical protein